MKEWPHREIATLIGIAEGTSKSQLSKAKILLQKILLQNDIEYVNENPNDDFHWKNKLENLESLPGETFNKEASWEKLHDRLQKKPK